MKTDFLKKHLPEIAILIVVFAFFAKLFFPPSFFITPDFGRSDILNSNLPEKLVLSQRLRSLEFPILENSFGQGYPIFAEGIIGSLYIPNLIIFFLFPFKLAIPITYVFTLLITGLGMYYLGKKLGFGVFASLASSLAFTFCASMMLHVQHINFIQAASLLPWIFLSILYLVEKATLKKAAICSLLFSQLFLTGFVQLFVYSQLVFFLIPLLQLSMTKRSRVINFVFFYLLVSVFSLAISAVQLLPSMELVRQSQRTSGINTATILNAFPLDYKNLLTYFNPFILGKASNGTYNSTDWRNTGIFWENTSYIGLLPFLSVLVSLPFIFWKKRGSIFFAVSVVLLLTIFLSLGKSSPLYVLYVFPPLNYFRVPARFILFTQFLASIIAAYGLKKMLDFLPKKYLKIAGFFILAAITLDIFYHWFNYNPTASAKSVLEKPQTAKTLSLDNTNDRIYSVASAKNWNSVFLKYGWEGHKNDYLFFLNSLDQNVNTLYGISGISMFETLPTRRYLLLHSIIERGITTNQDKATISQETKNLLDSLGVKYVISAVPIENADYIQTSVVSGNSYNYYIYKSQTFLNNNSFYYQYKVAKTVGNYQNLLSQNDPHNTVILENALNETFEQSKGNILSTSSRNGHSILNVFTEKPAILVQNNAYYPEWKAKIDSKETTIYPANINEMAVIVPGGKHNIEFIYRPNSIKLGAGISLISIIMLILIFYTNKLKSLKRSVR